MAEDIPDLPVSGSVSQAYRETLARLDELAKERDEARAAGRELVAENATLRAECNTLKAALAYAEKEIAGVLAEARRHAEKARGGAPERGRDERGGGVPEISFRPAGGPQNGPGGGPAGKEKPRSG